MTLPLPSLIRIPLRFFISLLPFYVVLFCRGEPLFDEFDFHVRRVALMGCHDLEHGAPTETVEGLDGWVFLAALGRIKSLSDVALYRPGKGRKILPGRPNPTNWPQRHHYYTSIRIYGWP
jgi:hypothetical protein